MCISREWVLLLRYFDRICFKVTVSKTQCSERGAEHNKSRNGENLCILIEFHAKKPSRAADFIKKCTNQAEFLNGPESRAHEYVILRAPPNIKESIRERRRRERRKFDVFYVKCILAKLVLAKRVRTRQSFENAPESPAHEYVVLRAPANTKGKGVFASVEGASREIWYILRVFYTIILCEAGFSKKATIT